MKVNRLLFVNIFTITTQKSFCKCKVNADTENNPDTSYGHGHGREARHHKQNGQEGRNQCNRITGHPKRRMDFRVTQAQYQNSQNATALKKLSDDVDYRLRTIEQQQQQQAQQALQQVPAPVADATTLPPATLSEGGAPTATKPALTGKDFPDSNTAYSNAFRLINEKKFAEASVAFDAFVKKYPKDPLTSNAYYWLGESYYARGDYTRAAVGFRRNDRDQAVRVEARAEHAAFLKGVLAGRGRKKAHLDSRQRRSRALYGNDKARPTGAIKAPATSPS